ncbi:hypothetical protein ANN_09176 [Periplaneta americana]|uniref:Tc1-like transposase DDE domain-containing protein n=1 Tax=Periplaneta americana TaxID=6978 RepID=A0ABQ8TKS8_PERAM|nr:hypothetical protein ANN_09176 [Periplaneta americana]
MAGLCEGGNEPPGSLKGSNAGPSSLSGFAHHNLARLWSFTIEGHSSNLEECPQQTCVGPSGAYLLGGKAFPPEHTVPRVGMSAEISCVFAAGACRVDICWNVESVEVSTKFPVSRKKLRCYECRFEVMAFESVVDCWEVLLSRQEKAAETIRKLREEGKPILYLDETWVDTNLTFRKCWQHKDVTGVLTTVNASNRLIVVHLGGINGFVEGCELVYKAGTATGDYHGQMNSNNFEKWVIEKIIPNLSTPSVILMDNAPYHGKQLDKVPTKSAVKKEMLDYLRRHGVPCEENMRKFTLFSLIEQIRPKQKVYQIDTIFANHGHTVVRLPPYMCDLSAIELAWSIVKNYVRSHNTTGDMSLKRLQELVQEGLKSVTKEDWTGYCKHVSDIENYYWEKYAIMENVIDEFIINVGDADTSDDDSSDESDDDSHNDSNTEDEDEDEESFMSDFVPL